MAPEALVRGSPRTVCPGSDSWGLALVSRELLGVTRGSPRMRVVQLAMQTVLAAADPCMRALPSHLHRCLWILGDWAASLGQAAQRLREQADAEERAGALGHRGAWALFTAAAGACVLESCVEGGEVAEGEEAQEARAQLLASVRGLVEDWTLHLVGGTPGAAGLYQTYREAAARQEEGTVHYYPCAQQSLPQHASAAERLGRLLGAGGQPAGLPSVLGSGQHRIHVTAGTHSWPHHAALRACRAAPPAATPQLPRPAPSPTRR